MNIITIRYKSTKYYLIETDKGLLAIDAGWPSTYRDYKSCIKEQGYKVDHIHWVIVTHFHIDHAGLAGFFIEKGIELIVFDNQLEKIKEMEILIEKKRMEYFKIDIGKITPLAINDSRSWLKSIGIDGEAIITNAHSEDSISVILDNGIAFIGDLPPESAIMNDDYKGKSNWQMLREKGARYFKPAHGPDFCL